MTHTDVRSQIRTALDEDGAPEILISQFLRSVSRVLDGSTGMIPADTIDPIEQLPHLDDLSALQAAGIQALRRCVMIKLNGGLGTGMGLQKAKSLLPVRDGLTFLDLIARQVLALRSRYGIPLPLVLMNSFSTEDDSRKLLQHYPLLMDAQGDLPVSFLQHRVPKLDAATFLPVRWPDNPGQEWCPPGHGDIYTALAAGGLLDKLIEDGFHYAFVSNADNLGATLAPSILGYMTSDSLPFLMEATRRTPADRKGGHLAREKATGRLLLREVAQCPDDEQEAFQDIDTYRFFNTNNLWVDLRALQQLIKDTGSAPDLPLILNRKTVDPKDAGSPAVYQVESAMGTLLSSFDHAGAIEVPRSRFSPVKTTDDLLALRSDAYVITEDMNVVLNPMRKLHAPPRIHLDPAHYKDIDDFSERFPGPVPSLNDCTRFDVQGDILFGDHVVIAGTVTLVNPAAESYLVENRQYSGSPLRDTFTVG